MISEDDAAGGSAGGGGLRCGGGAAVATTILSARRQPPLLWVLLRQRCLISRLSRARHDDCSVDAPAQGERVIRQRLAQGRRERGALLTTTPRLSHGQGERTSEEACTASRCTSYCFRYHRRALRAKRARACAPAVRFCEAGKTLLFVCADAVSAKWALKMTQKNQE